MRTNNSAPPRIAPLEAPFVPEVAEELARWQPPKQQPIALFRTLARHLLLARAMFPIGHYFLSRDSSIAIRDREVVIDRVCARCGCEYEWGVHARVFRHAAGLDEAQLRSSVVGSANDTCWTESDRLLVRMVDELHDSGKITDELWAKMLRHWSQEQLLELLVLTGWYHAISFVASGVRVRLEDGATRFPATG
jgi:alkylhydroperoxidase family enzyme